MRTKWKNEKKKKKKSNNEKIKVAAPMSENGDPQLKGRSKDRRKDRRKD